MLLDVYGCVDEPQRWGKWLDALCPALGVRSAIVQVLDQDGLRLHQRWCARDSLSATHADLHDRFVNNDRNPRMNLQLMSQWRQCGILRDRDRFAPDCREYANFRDRLSVVGLGLAVGLRIPLGNGSAFALMLHRPLTDSRPFTNGEEGFLRDLMPHLQQMLRLAARREGGVITRAIDGSILDQLRAGVIICDTDRRVEWLNESAQQLLQQSPCMEERNGFLRCKDNTDDRRLSSLFCRINSTDTQPERRFSSAFRMGDVDAVHVLAFSLVFDRGPMSVSGASSRRTVLIVSEPRRGAIFSPEGISDLLGLTPAEATLAAALCSGHSLQDYADHRGISVGTARVQLKRILAKTDTHRQADLVRQICCSVLGYGLSANGS
ncbi:MAG: helix-turn-helix transcriptional regulator, partial [Novosphingobium sp.]